VYALDTFWAANRANDPIGSEEQTGLRFGTPAGDALGHALRAVARHEGSLLGGFRAPYRVGPWLVGRRAGGFEFWVSTSDRPEYCPAAGRGEVVTPAGVLDFSAGGTYGPGCVIVARGGGR
jgi:hypothetical protein